MWAHDISGRSESGGLPIGRTRELRRDGSGRLVADFEFLGEDAFAQRVKNAWDKGFLRAASISWLPIEGEPSEGGRWRDTRSDLLEWSIVAVPADPDALRESQSRMIRALVADEEGGTSREIREIVELVTAVRRELAGGGVGHGTWMDRIGRTWECFGGGPSTGSGRTDGRGGPSTGSG